MSRLLLAAPPAPLLLPARCDSSRVTFARQWAAQVEQSALIQPITVTAPVLTPAQALTKAQAKLHRQSAALIERFGKAQPPTAWAGPANKWGAIKPVKPADLASEYDDTCATELTGSLKRVGEKALTLLTLERSGPAFEAKKPVKPTRREQYASWKASAEIAGQTAPLTGYREAVAAWREEQSRI